MKAKNATNRRAPKMNTPANRAAERRASGPSCGRGGLPVGGVGGVGGSVKVCDRRRVTKEGVPTGRPVTPFYARRAAIDVGTGDHSAGAAGGGASSGFGAVTGTGGSSL